MLLFVFALFFLTSPASAATRSWTGDGPLVNGFRHWSHPDNWSPNGAPQNGDELSFHEYNAFAGSTTMINDLPNLTVHSLTIWYQADFLTHDWTLHGNTLGISHDILLYFTTGQDVHFNCGLRLEDNVLVTVDSESELYVNGPVDLNGHDLALEVYDESVNVFFYGGVAEFSGSISGNGNIHIYPNRSPGGSGAGTLSFNGTAPNTFLGAVTQYSQRQFNGQYRGVEMILDKQTGPAIPGALMMSTNCVTRLARANQLADHASVRITAGGQLLLDGHADTIGSLFLTNTANATAATRVDTGGAVLSVVGDITAANHGPFTPMIIGRLNLPTGDHMFHVSGSVYEGLDVQAQMLGFGNFSKSGNAALLLQASNSFNSTISILKGVLDVRNDHALGDIAGSTQIFEGNLTLRNVAIGAELLFALGGTEGEFPGSALTSIGVSSWAGQVALYTNLVVTGGDMTFTGPISGTGSLGCFSVGTMRLSGSLTNTYTGTTLVRCPLVEFNKPYGVNAFSGPLVVGGLSGGPVEARWLNYYQSPGTLLTLYANGLVNLNNTTERFGAITFNGGQIDSGPFGICVLGNPANANPSYLTVNAATTSAIINGYFLPAGGAAWVTVSNGVVDPDLLINAGVVGNAPQIIKQGAGTMRLTGAGNYSGVTIVNEGILDVGHNTALGSASFGTIVNEAATLRLSSFGIVPEGFALSGTGVGGTNGVIHVTGNPTVTGASFLNGPSTINVAPGAGLAVDSVISGTGPLTKTGPGNLFLGGVSGGVGNNTYSGSTIVNAGTLHLSKNQNVLSVPGPLVVGPATIGSPAAARFSRSGTMPAAGTAAVNANSLLDLNGNNQLLSQLHLNDGGDAQTGAGTLSFTGFGSVNVGTLNPGLPGLQASASISGRMAAMTDEYLLFNIAPYGLNPLSPEPELVVSAQIVGTRSSIAKNGQGAMWLSGNNTFDGTTSIVTEFNINDGAVIAASSTALGGPNNWVYVINGASLALVNYITINKPLFLNSTNPAALDNRGGINEWSGPISFSQDSGISVNLDWSLTVPSAVTGTGALIKRGAGLLRLSGAANNTHSGNTHVEAGTLLLAKSAFLQAVPHDLIIGSGQPDAPATLARYLNHDQVWNQITVNGNGLLDLNGYEEYSGTLTLNSGGDVQTGLGTYYLANNANLIVNPGSANNPAIISGKLGLFPGQHLFGVAAGVTTPGQFDLNLPATVLQSSTGANIIKTGAGSVRLGGTNSYTGSTYVSSGTLQVDGVQPQSLIELDHETRLQGSGTVGHIIFNGSFLGIAPGSSPGSLTCSNFDASGGSGKLEMELNAHPTGYDQLIARGTVDLRGLDLNASLNFTSTVGQQFTLINNDGVDAITGTFTGLPQNKKLYVGSELFQISYAGGTGNDVVLTRLVTPPPPTLRIERLSATSVRLIWATNDPAYRLQSHTNFTTTNWISATPLPTLLNTNHVVTNTISGGGKLYRLINP